MKHFTLLVAIILLFSCDNELNVIEEARDIPIVYGFLSSSDSTQYIRVERAFVDKEISALELAKNPDSLYYPTSVSVSIRDLNSQTIYQAERINGNEEGLQREDGVFVSEPNILYKIGSDVKIEEDHDYEFILNRGDEQDLVTATTNIVGTTSMIRPNPVVNDPKIDFASANATQFKWRQADNAVIYDLILTFNYRERTEDTQYEPKSLVWELAKGLTIEEHAQRGSEFFSVLAASVEKNPELIRRFEDITIDVVSGNQQLLEYIRIIEANLGITSTQDIPTYTNLSEGRGIFASRNTYTFPGIGLSNGTIDSLINGSVTKDLNFTN